MVLATLTPFDSVEVETEKNKLREIVDRYDNLMEDCWRGRLRSRDEKELDRLHEFLIEKEADLWRDTSLLLVDQLTELMEIPFPFLRYTIGMLPN